MARPRKKPPAETPYQRRIRRYLEAHPGATRQEARGHRLREGERSEYARRTARARTAEERREAGGKSGKLRAFLRDLTDGAVVMVDAEEALKHYDPERRIFRRMTKWMIGGRRGDQPYTFRLSLERFRRLLEQELAAGAILAPSQSLNQASLLAAIEEEESE